LKTKKVRILNLEAIRKDNIVNFFFTTTKHILLEF
jgi:hypothetical protein